MSTLGLRSKALLAMFLACLLILVPSSIIGWRVLDNIHRNLAQSFVRNTTLLNRSKISAPLLRELALAKRLADSELTRQWLRDESNPRLHDQFFREAEAYRGDLQDHVYFVGSLTSQNYYLNTPLMAPSTAPRHRMQPGQAEDAWFYSTLNSTTPYNINIDRNLDSNDVKIWCNVKVMQGKHLLGVAGSGVNLTSFLAEFIQSKDPGLSAMIVNPQGAIQVYADKQRVAINSGASGASARRTNLFGMLSSTEEATALRAAMRQAENQSASVPLLWTHIDGQPRLLALSYIPELKWHVVTLLNLQAAQVIDPHWLWPLLALMAGLLLLLALGFALVIERVLLRPLYRLQDSARAVAGGQYDLVLPKPSQDEIGDLTSAFATMTAKIRSHTQELERRVSERTHDLERTNHEMTVAQKKIADSINYASLIQRAILPKGHEPCADTPRADVLWLPRDVVGGDFYLRRVTPEGTLLGVVDCAGHGVPGAMMTMLAYSAIDQAIAEVGLPDPAAILQRADAIARAMLPPSDQSNLLTTSMDMGLAYIQHSQAKVTFSGAKMSLYMSNGQQVEILAASRRALVDTRRAVYANVQTTLQPGYTFYLVSDGFLDQAGGDDGFGFGDRRFTDMLMRYAHLPLAAQIRAFRATLAEYQGTQTQRDDITLLCFTHCETHEETERHDAV